MLKYQIKSDELLIEVPESATRQEIDEFTDKVYENCPETKNLLVNYEMVDTGQQIY